MTTVVMTAEETDVYDNGDDRAGHRLMSDLLAKARAMREASGEPVEIHTADGIVAGLVQ